MIFIPNTVSSSSTISNQTIRKSMTCNPFFFTKSNIEPLNKDYSKSQWQQKENTLYGIFLDFFLKKFTYNSQDTKCQWILFKSMSNFVKTRNANQCRIHHKKMLSQHGSEQRVIEFIRD
jgi:hypothetical protein